MSQDLESIPQQKLRLFSDTPQSGPDGWPYLFVSTENGTESAVEVLRWLSRQGVGLVVNPDKSEPDCILTYGMIWNFAERGSFLSSVPSFPEDGGLDLEKGDRFSMGPPGADYLPEYVRQILREFFRQQSVFSPEVGLLFIEREKSLNLCFKEESLGKPAKDELPGICEAISWFLPRHYAVMIANEGQLPGHYEEL